MQSFFMKEKDKIELVNRRAEIGTCQKWHTMIISAHVDTENTFFSTLTYMATWEIMCKQLNKGLKSWGILKKTTFDPYLRKTHVVWRQEEPLGRLFLQQYLRVWTVTMSLIQLARMPNSCPSLKIHFYKITLKHFLLAPCIKVFFY